MTGANSLLQAFIGAFLSLGICAIVPPLLYLKLISPLSWAERVLAGTVSSLGVVGAIAGTVYSVQHIARGY